MSEGEGWGGGGKLGVLFSTIVKASKLVCSSIFHRAVLCFGLHATIITASNHMRYQPCALVVTRRGGFSAPTGFWAMSFSKASFSRRSAER